MFCNSCGKQVADNERFCPNCGAPLAPAKQAPGFKAPAASASGSKTINIGSLKFTLAQFISCIAAIVGFLAFIMYMLPVGGISAYGYRVTLSLWDLPKGGYTLIFVIIGLIFTLAAVVLVALPVIKSIKEKKLDNTIEFPLFPFALYFIGFLIYVISAGTVKSGALPSSFWNVMYIIFSIIFFAYCGFAAFVSFKANNNKLKISLLGNTLWEQK